MSKKHFKLTSLRITERLRIMNNNALELLSKETTRLLRLQSDELTKALSTKNFLNNNTEQQDETIGEKKVQEWLKNLENERQKLEKMEMVIAVIGTMKAGKSTTINAIVGMEILPNRETAMTTLPTLIRNKHGQLQPVLKIEKIKPLLDLSKQVAKRLKNLSDTEKNQINLNGIEDGKTLIAQLVEQNGYPFKTEYAGQEGIFEFLKHLNDIMRLAKDAIIAVEPPYHEYENLKDLPVIEVEFCHLRGMQATAHGSLAILDTPGPNEFGQSEALRRVFKTQLEKASAILLAIDFTQMNTQADDEVRVQLNTIKEQLSKDRLYVVVNKFDLANKNSMKADEVKKYVAETLMDGNIDIAQVFPVSSYLAYFANRAKGHLEQHRKLPAPEQEPWVADFAKIAFGECWDKKDITNINGVQTAIEKLWKRSFFEEPIDKVIKEAHATAANKSLASAIEKLAYYNAEFLNTLNLRSNAMTKSIIKIREDMKGLQADIANCEKVEQEVDEKVKLALSELSQTMKGVMDAQWKHVNETIVDFFKKGKEMEETTQQKMLNDKVKQQLDSLNIKNAARGILSQFAPFGMIFKQQDEKYRQNTKRKINQLFDPTSPKITCATAYEANELTVEVTKAIANIFENADKQLNSLTNDLIKSTGVDISQQINTAVGDTLEKAKNKLSDNGAITLNFELPNVDLKIADVDTSALFKAGYHEKTESKTGTRHKEGIWGGICSWFNTNDWGTEQYSYQTSTYTVDIEKIKAKVLEQLQEQVRHLSNQTGTYLSKTFQPKIHDHLSKLEEYLQRYLGVLADGMKSSELDQTEKSDLITQLEKFSKAQTVIKNDIHAVKIAI